MLRAVAFSLVVAAALPAAPKKGPATGRGESESIEVTATLYTTPEAIKELIGDDLGGHYTVVAVRVVSRFGREVDVKLDDFMLRTDKDGERSGPFAASQIAGRGALVVSEGGVRSGGGMGGNSGGPGTMGRTPMGGGSVGGGGGAEVVENKTKMQSGAGQKIPVLQKTLEAKALPEGKTDKSLAGLLYFPLEKQRVKDLELYYKAADGKISLRFKQ